MRDRTVSAARPTRPAAAPLQAAFLSILPRVELHAAISFRHVRCRQQRAECVAETVALAWRSFTRLAEKGRDATRFPAALATLAARAVRSGRRLCGQERASDVLSPVAQRRRGFTVRPLPQSGGEEGSLLEEALCDNTLTPVDEQVVFRVDFPAWRNTRTERDRRLLDALMVGERTVDVSRRYRLTPGRVSQLRREFHADWTRFCAAPGEVV
jgi:hypothetical protein